ncbi:MAG: hypothetical protein K5697_12660 [Lachnospiraceae bacterium]|nr:hypothetical protein [Lachnospiraceae bacterium]
MLRMEMILAAPGKGLHVLLGKLRKRPDVGRALFLTFLILAVGLGLWLMRKDLFILLVGGAALAITVFLIYRPVLKGIKIFLTFLEAATHVFAKSYDDCRRALRLKKNTAGNTASGGPEPASGQRGDPVHSARAQSAAAGASGAAKQEKVSAENAQEKQESPEEERCRREEEAQAWARAKQKARQEKRYEQTEKKRRRMEEEAERERAKRGGPKAKTDRRPHESSAALEEAKSIFNVEIPFSEAEIKEKRNLLIRKYHPDNPGGSEEMCKKINECYAILYKYAS